MKKIFLFLLISCTQIACQKLSNALDSAILSCGPSLESGLWIKVHPGDGFSLPTDLKAVGLKRSSALPEALKMTEKGCVQVDEAHDTVVVSSATTKFGAVYAQDQGKRDITLKNIGDLKTTAYCEPETFTNEKVIQLPLRLTQVGDDLLQKAFRVRVSIHEASQGKSIQVGPTLGLESELDLASLEDGRYIFDFQVNNFFSLATENHQCIVTVDHQKPEVEAKYLSLHGQSVEHVFLQPAENLFLEFEPGSQVDYCLFKEELAQSCEEFRPYESFITVPERGYWSLLYKARDKAGNESEIKRLRILAYDVKSLENISLKSTLSSLYSSEGKYTEALAEAIDAEKKRLRLGSELEKNEVLLKVQEALLNSMAKIRLKHAPAVHRNRVMQIRMSDSLASSDYRFAAVDFDHTVKILSPDGQVIHDLRLHTDTIKAAEFVPGSFDLITGGKDGRLIFWSSDGTAQAIMLDHQGGINDVAVQQLNGDNQIIVASASADKTVRIWDRAGKAIRTLQHDDAVTAVTIGPDGKAYSGDASGSLYFWAADFTLISKIDPAIAHSSAVYELVLGQDQDGAGAIVSAANGEALKVWTERGAPIRTLADTSYEGYPTWTNGLHYTETCRYLAIASGSDVVLLDRTNFGQDKRFSVGENITSIAISHRCDRIAVGDGSNQMSLWTLQGHLQDKQLFPDYIYDIRFDKSDKYLVVGRQDNHLGIYAIDNLIPSLKTDVPFGSSLLQARMDAKGEFVVSGSQNGQVDLWKLRSDGAEQRSIAAHEGLVMDVQLDASNDFLLTMDSGSSAKLWDLRTGDLKAKLDHELKVSEILFLKNSPFIVTGSGYNPALPNQPDAGELRLWSRTGELLASDRSFEGTVYRVEEHPSLNLIAVVEEKLHIYRVEDFGRLTKLAEYNGEFLSRVKWLNHSQGEPELVISDSRTLSVLRLENDKLRLVFSQNMEASIRSIEVGSNASLIAVGDFNGNLRILARDGSLKFVQNFGTHALSSLAFDAHGSRLAFSLGSGKFAILDVNRGTIQTFNAHGAAVVNLQFAEDGRLLSADENGYMRLWSFKQEQLLQDACQFIRSSLRTLAAYQNLCEVE